VSKPQTLWCVQTKNGRLMLNTIHVSKEGAFGSLFNEMPEDFQKKYWKKVPESREAYKKLGLGAVRVLITPLVRCWACLRTVKGKPTTVKHICGR
jgi:hypothetical protein